MHTYVSFPGRLFLINRRKIDSKYIHFVASTLYIWDKFLLWPEHILVRVRIFFLSAHCACTSLLWHHIVDFCYKIRLLNLFFNKNLLFILIGSSYWFWWWKQCSQQKYIFTSRWWNMEPYSINCWQKLTHNLLQQK